MNKIIYIFLLSALSVAARASNPDISVIHVFLHPALEQNNSDDKIQNSSLFKNLQISVYITNNGSRDLLIPTSQAVAFDFEDTKENLINIKFKYVINEDDITGVVVIVPESSLGLVALRPGETTVINYRTSARERVDGKIKVEYAVSNEFAKRYGTWSGMVGAISKPYAPQISK